MHILLASHRFARHSAGGTEVLTEALGTELARRGWTVSWLASEPDGDRPADCAGAGGGIDEWPIAPRFGAAYPRHWREDEAAQARSIEEWLRRKPPVDIIHIHHFARIGLEFTALPALAAVPLFVTLTDYTTICPDFQLFHRPTGTICSPDAPASLCAGCCSGPVEEGEIAAWRQRNLDVVNRRADSLFAMTPHQRALLIRGGVEAAKFAGDHLAYPLPASWADRPAWRRGEGPFRFGVIGRISPEKGVPVAAAAVAPLHRALGCTLHIWGAPDGQELGEGDGVILHAPLPLDRLVEAFDAIDCLLIPSLWLENHPLVLMYALALGVPAIASDVESLRHLAHEPLLSFAPPGDVAGWTEAMERRVADPPAPRRRDGVVLRNEDFARQVDLLESLYRRSLSRRFADYRIDDDFDRYGIVPGRPSPSPGFLQVELTDRCNLTCTSCPRSTVASTEVVLGLEAFAALLDDAPGLEHVSFVGGGEALFVHDFHRYVRLCSERGIRSSTVTNGLLIPLRAKAAIQAGLTRLGISVDSATDAGLRAIRGGMGLAALERSLRAAVELTAGTGTALFAAITLSATNVHDFADIVELLARLGLRELSVEGLHHWGEDRSLDGLTLQALAPALVIRSIERGLAVARRAALRVSIFDYERLADPAGYRDAHCPWPWDAAFITSRGEVTPCCIHLTPAGEHVLGRVTETSFDRIWSGDPYRRFRASFQTPDEWESCRSCVYRMEFGKARSRP